MFWQNVALFTRAWIEIPKSRAKKFVPAVALFTRAWIEILRKSLQLCLLPVALFTRAWIEIDDQTIALVENICRPLHEGVD